MAGEALPVTPGELIGERYRVERVIGRGSMAFVVAARDEQIDERVAVVILRPERAASPEIRERFAREARAAVEIESEHVARVEDVGELADGTPYIVREYLDGEDFASLLERRGKIPVAEAVHLVLQVCDALREAHSLGVIHRDMKPANLFLAETRGRPPTVKVLDFGVPKIERHDRRRADRNEILGSPWYMAPEQMKSATSADARSDIWSLGIILYEMVTGTVPFDGDTMTEVVVKVLHDALPLGKLPRELEPVIRRCVAKAPQARYGSVDELAGALRALSLAPGDVPVTRARRRTSGELVLGLDDVELVDDAAPPGDDDAEVVTEAELISSDPPPRVAADDATTPIAPPVVEPTTPIAPPVAAGRADPAGDPMAVTQRRPRARVEPPRRPSRRWPWIAVAAALVPIGAYAARKWSMSGARAPVPAPPLEGHAQAPRAVPSEAVSSEVPCEPVPPSPPASSVAAAEPAASADVVVAGGARRDAPPVARDAAPAPSPPSKDDDDAAVAFDVARRHHASVKQACWDGVDHTTASAVVNVAVTIDETGAVTSARGTGADSSLARCVEAQVRTWTFPPSARGRSLAVPIRFRR